MQFPLRHKAIVYFETPYTSENMPPEGVYKIQCGEFWGWDESVKILRGHSIRLMPPEILPPAKGPIYANPCRYFFVKLEKNRTQKEWKKLTKGSGPSY